MYGMSGEDICVEGAQPCAHPGAIGGFASTIGSSKLSVAFMTGVP